MRIAVIHGDGGKEVIPDGLRARDAAAGCFGIDLAAIEAVLADDAARGTPDLGGSVGTTDVGLAIAQAIAAGGSARGSLRVRGCPARTPGRPGCVASSPPATPWRDRPA